MSSSGGFAAFCNGDVVEHFVALCKSIEDGREVIRGMINFWKSVATIEDTYGKGLLALCSPEAVSDSFFLLKWFKKGDLPESME